MKRLAVTGYASLDYVVSLDGMATGNHTTRIANRDRGAWPRLGGCVSYVARAAAQVGAQAQPITWVGDDENGRLYRDKLDGTGASTEGVAIIPGESSPLSVLVYQADSSCICLFDTGLIGGEALTDTQAALIGGADLVCITVGPPDMIPTVLDLVGSETPLALVLKNDADCFPAAHLRSAIDRADYVFCNASENALIAASDASVHRAGLIVIETAGTEGLTVREGSRTQTLTTAALDVRDTTGAGDTLAGAFLAAILAGTEDPMAAAQAGIEATTALLRERQMMEQGNQ